MPPIAPKKPALPSVDSDQLTVSESIGNVAECLTPSSHTRSDIASAFKQTCSSSHQIGKALMSTGKAALPFAGPVLGAALKARKSR